MAPPQLSPFPPRLAHLWGALEAGTHRLDARGKKCTCFACRRGVPLLPTNVGPFE